MTDEIKVTVATREVHQTIQAKLPFGDETDFDNARRGHIACWPEAQILGAKGHPIWDIEARKVVQGDCPESVNPSLWRQAQLNNIHGLFKVTDRIYQVRGYDLANITFIEGDTGWVVIDTGMTADIATASLKLANDQLGERPVTGVIYTHSHVDHYGGARGIITEEDAQARNVPIIAPDGFLREAVSENLLAGATMRRRATYMYGLLLPLGPQGHVDVGLGPGNAGGSIGLVAPNDIIYRTGEERVVDGVRIQFQFTPDAEAPAEIMFYFPDFKALCTSEVVTHILHNVYTPRGAKVRDALAWAKYIHELMGLFSDAEVVFASHHWPTWGRENVQRFLGLQRDLYKYLHDETLRLANQGLTPLEIAEEIALPDSLAREFTNRDYYGTVSHNVKAIYQLYFGWFDGNPANLHAHPPEVAGRKYVDFMGGADAVIAKAQASFDEGDYRWVAQVLNHVVFADPSNGEAREMLARAYDQMAYQAESGPWRDFYLTGAQELRLGAPKADIKVSLGSLETIKAVPIDLFFDVLAVRLNGPKANGLNLSLNFIYPDVDERIGVTIGNSVLNYTMGSTLEGAQATITMNRSVWNEFSAELFALEDAVADGRIEVDGDIGSVKRFYALLDDFEVFFNIVEP